MKKIIVNAGGLSIIFEATDDFAIEQLDDDSIIVNGVVPADYVLLEKKDVSVKVTSASNHHQHGVQSIADLSLKRYIAYPFVAVLEVPDIRRIYDSVSPTVCIMDFTAIIGAVAEYTVTDRHASLEKFIMLIICYAAIAANLCVIDLVLELGFNYINRDNIQYLYAVIRANAVKYRSIRTKLLSSTTIFTEVKPQGKAYDFTFVKIVSEALNAGYRLIDIEKWTGMTSQYISMINTGKLNKYRLAGYTYPINRNSKWPKAPTGISVKWCRKCNCLIPAIHVASNPTIEYCPDCYNLLENSK